jgi:hypothetical protein
MKLRVKASICIAFGLCIFCSGARAEGRDSIGPFGALLSNNDVISGQMNALAIDPRDANTSMSALPKEECGRHRMEARADTQVRKLASGKLRGTPSIDSLAINPVTPDIVYAGTGDPNVACCFVGSGLGRVSLTRWRKHLDCGRLKPKPDRLRRSPGVPYVSVTDLEVQQVFQAHDLAESSAPELMVAECLS